MTLEPKVIGQKGLTISDILKVLVKVSTFTFMAQNNLEKIAATLGVDIKVFSNFEFQKNGQYILQVFDTVLKTWISKEVQNATVNVLIDALKDSEMNDCADALHLAFISPITDSSSVSTASATQQLQYRPLEANKELVAYKGCTPKVQLVDIQAAQVNDETHRSPSVDCLQATISMPTFLPNDVQFGSRELDSDSLQTPLECETAAQKLPTAIPDIQNPLEFSCSNPGMQTVLKKELPKPSEGQPLLFKKGRLDSSKSSQSTVSLTPNSSSSDLIAQQSSVKKTKGNVWRKRISRVICPVFLSSAFVVLLVCYIIWSKNVKMVQPLSQNINLTNNKAKINEALSTTETAIAVKRSSLTKETLRDTTTVRDKTTEIPIFYIHKSSSLLPNPVLGKKRTKTNRQRIIASTPSQLKNRAESICDTNFKTHIILYKPNPYEFADYQYDCPTRISGISFVDTGWFIDQIASLLNLTERLTHLVFNGSDICNRNEGIRSNLLGDISLYDLEHLEFINLRGPESSPTADCTELFSWVASYIVKDVTLKSLSFRGAMFTLKNKEDIHQLCVEAFNSNRLKQLNILATLNVEMFNLKKALQSRNLTAISFDATNPSTSWAKKSLFNFINYFLNGSTTVTFSTNITLEFEKFRRSVKALHSIGVRSLEISVFVKDCDIVNFEFLHDIPNVLKFQMKLMFSAECQLKAKKFPIKFQRLGHLDSSSNYHEFRLSSNAYFRPEGASDLHCRGYIKKNTELMLDRNSKC